MWEPIEFGWWEILLILAIFGIGVPLVVLFPVYSHMIVAAVWGRMVKGVGLRRCLFVGTVIGAVSLVFIWQAETWLDRSSLWWGVGFKEIEAGEASRNLLWLTDSEWAIRVRMFLPIVSMYAASIAVNVLVLMGLRERFLSWQKKKHERPKVPKAPA